MLQCVAVCVVVRVAVCCSELKSGSVLLCCSVCCRVCCGVCGGVCGGVLRCVAATHPWGQSPSSHGQQGLRLSVLQCVAVRCSVLQCVLQCVAARAQA